MSYRSSKRIGRLFPSAQGPIEDANENEAALLSVLRDAKRRYETADKAKSRAENAVKLVMRGRSGLSGAAGMATWRNTRDWVQLDTKAIEEADPDRFNALLAEFPKLRGGERKFVVNFSETGYIDSSGLGVLVSLSKKIREQEGVLRLANLNEDLRTLFELTKLDTLFEIADTREEALEGL